MPLEKEYVDDGDLFDDEKQPLRQIHSLAFIILNNYNLFVNKATT